MTWYFTWIPGNVVSSCHYCYWDVRHYLSCHPWTDPYISITLRDTPSPAQSNASVFSALTSLWLMIALFKLALCPCHFSILGPLRRGPLVQLLAGLHCGVHLSVCAHALFSAFPKDRESMDNIALGLECWLPHTLEGSKEKSHCHLPTFQSMNKVKQNKTKNPAQHVLQPGSFFTGTNA